MEDLKEIVIEQGESISKCEDNTHVAAKATDKAVEQIIKTEQKTKFSNTKYE